MSTNTNTKIAVLSLLAVVGMMLGVAVSGVAAQSYGDGTDLQTNDTVVEDVAPGETVTVELEVDGVTNGSIDVSYNESATIQYDDGSNTTVAAGDPVTSVNVDVNSTELSDGNGSVFIIEDITYSPGTENKNVTNNIAPDLSVGLSGNLTSTGVNQTAVEGPDDSGLFGGLGGENTGGTLLILAVVVGGLLIARERDII